MYIAGALLKNSDGVPKLQILICYNKLELAVATYKQRWQIETCFRAMKTAGVNIEDTHLRDIERIARLTAMVCLALVWPYLVGEHKDINVKAIKILKHGRKAKSLVQYGLEEISNVLMRQLYMPKFDVFNLWRAPIGLQAVDNLRVSNFLIETAHKHIEGLISMDEVTQMIDEHYAQKRKQSRLD